MKINAKNTNRLFLIINENCSTSVDNESFVLSNLFKKRGKSLKVKNDILTDINDAFFDNEEDEVYTMKDLDRAITERLTIKELINDINEKYSRYKQVEHAEKDEDDEDNIKVFDPDNPVYCRIAIINNGFKYYLMRTSSNPEFCCDLVCDPVSATLFPLAHVERFLDEGKIKTDRFCNLTHKAVLTAIYNFLPTKAIYSFDLIVDVFDNTSSYSELHTGDNFNDIKRLVNEPEYLTNLREKLSEDEIEYLKSKGIDL